MRTTDDSLLATLSRPIPLSSSRRRSRSRDAADAPRFRISRLSKKQKQNSSRACGQGGAPAKRARRAAVGKWASRASRLPHGRATARTRGLSTCPPTRHCPQARRHGRNSPAPPTACPRRPVRAARNRDALRPSLGPTSSQWTSASSRLDARDAEISASGHVLGQGSAVSADTTRSRSGSRLPHFRSDCL